MANTGLRNSMPSPSPDIAMARADRWKGKMISFGKQRQSGADWAREFGLGTSTFYARFNSGWSMTRIKDTPVVGNGRPCLGPEPITHWRYCVPRRTNCVHPICTAIFEAMKRQRCTYQMLADRSGVSYSAIQSMRSHGPGYFVNVEACANTLGLNIVASRQRGGKNDG